MNIFEEMLRRVRERWQETFGGKKRALQNIITATICQASAFVHCACCQVRIANAVSTPIELYNVFQKKVPNGSNEKHFYSWQKHHCWLWHLKVQETMDNFVFNLHPKFGSKTHIYIGHRYTKCACNSVKHTNSIFTLVCQLITGLMAHFLIMIY